MSNSSDNGPAERERILWEGQPQQHCGVGHWWWLFIAPVLMWPLLLWSFTGPVPEGAANFHEWASDGFCRLVIFILAASHTAVPFLMARSTNRSSYRITSRRVIMRKPGLMSSNYADEYDYAHMHSLSLRMLDGGLASVSFEGLSPRRSESTHELLHAIPAGVARDVERLVDTAHRG